MAVDSLTQKKVKRQKRHFWRTAEGRRARWGYIFILPWLIGLLAFNLYPILSVFYYGFTNYSGLQTPNFIGIDNYVEMLKYDKLFFKALGNTGFYVAMRVPLHLLVGFIAALLANRKLRGIQFFRTGLYFPTIVPYVTSVVLWMSLLNYQYGVINTVLQGVGLEPVRWLGSETMAKPSIVLINLWQVGTIMMTFLAGLNDIPESLYESADIDGANSLQKLFWITIPMLSPVIFYNLVLDVINSFQVFTAALIATGGGPLNATLFYVFHMYREAFTYLHIGYASAMAVVLFLVVLVFTIFLVRSERYWVVYGRI